jgi:short-subunit dehydrogenase
MMHSYQGKTIWVIGASSGIGAALASELSKRGANVLLSARDHGKLATVRQRLSGPSALYPLDVAVQEDVRKTVRTIFAEHGRIDSVVYLAALYEPTKISALSAEKAIEMFSANIFGAFYLLEEILPHLQKQGFAQIALCGSVAGYRGLPNGQPYSATKAAIMNLAETTRCELSAQNIDVKLISPGFVKTPMTAKNDFFMPMMIEPERAAVHIADGLLSRKFEIRFPFVFTTLMKLVRILPDFIYFRLLRT